MDELGRRHGDFLDCKDDTTYERNHIYSRTTWSLHHVHEKAINCNISFINESSRYLCGSTGLTEKSREQRKELVALLDPAVDFVYRAIGPCLRQVPYSYLQ